VQVFLQNIRCGHARASGRRARLIENVVKT
jgi:hypothetical protein